MATQGTSTFPIIMAMVLAMLCFAAWVPWLIRESRRPLPAPSVRTIRRSEHKGITAIALYARSVELSLSPSFVRPRPTLTADLWRSLHTKGAQKMPQPAWSAKRERQYEHIEAGLEKAGRPKKVAKEIAARTVNKERARAGEAATSSRSSTDDVSSGRRGGLRSHQGPGGRTKAQLYNEAKHKNVKGRSKMSKRQLEKAVSR